MLALVGHIMRYCLWRHVYYPDTTSKI